MADGVAESFVRDRAERALAEVSALANDLFGAGKIVDAARVVEKAAGIRLVLSFMDDTGAGSASTAALGWRLPENRAVWSGLRLLCRVGIHNVSCRGRRDH